MATKRKNSDTIDLTNSTVTQLPAPSTSRNRHPRSSASSRSRSNSGHGSLVEGEEIIHTSLLSDAEEDLHHGRKRRRIVSGEDHVPEDISLASTSSSVLLNPPIDLNLGSSLPLNEHVEPPPLTQESQALSDAISSVDDTSDDIIIVKSRSLRPIVIDDPILLPFTDNPTTSHSPHASPEINATISPSSAPEALSNYTCPICFSPPINATLTPCGHICCGACLFTAVKSTVKRNMVIAMDRAPVPRCPVCRAEIPGWDGRGGGVVGLKAHFMYSL